MPYNFYAETSFTAICGRGYFGIHLHDLQKYRPCPQLFNDRRPRTPADGRYPVLPAAVSAMYSVLSDCHRLKMKPVMSYTD